MFEEDKSDAQEKRELFAILALQGIIAASGPASPSIHAGWAVQYADALIKKLEEVAP